MEKRYYYKCGNSLLNLKSAVNNPEYIEITEQEFNELSKPKEPTAEQKALQAKRNRLAELHRLLEELDYIGTKIATGRATREEYATEIALMDEYAAEINELEEELKELKNEKITYFAFSTYVRIRFIRLRVRNGKRNAAHSYI